LQIEQVFEDLRAQLETQITPKTWPELLEILALQKRRWIFCLERVVNFSALFAAICLRPLPSQIVISLMCGTKGLSN
jgi:hypothetical protein